MTATERYIQERGLLVVLRQFSAPDYGGESVQETAMRLAANEVERLQAALRPFAAFAEKAEAFVDARAKDGGSPILRSTDFRLADFRRARAALEQA